MRGQRDTNRRREPRVALDTPVRISTIDPETDPGTGRRFFRSSSETCANVSRTGLFIRTSEPLEPGRRLLVELTLPDGEDIDAVGRVAWVKRSLAPEQERGVGVELLGATSEELARLQAFIARSSDAARAGTTFDEPASRTPAVDGKPPAVDGKAPAVDGKARALDEKVDASG